MASQSLVRCAQYEAEAHKSGEVLDRTSPHHLLADLRDSMRANTDFHRKFGMSSVELRFSEAMRAALQYVLVE